METRNLFFESRSASPAVPISHLSLPLPESIALSLRNAGCTEEAARSLSDAFLRSAHQIRDMYHSTHRQTCTKMAQNLLSDPNRLALRLQNLGSFLRSQYQERIHAAEQVAIHRVEDMQRSQRVARKAAFNPEFVPLLEKYFEYNAYPSAPDRAALAKKSMMTSRQIEVWFQNHRNRSKKEGKALRRLTLDPLPLKLSLKSLERKMPFFIIPEAERKARIDGSDLQSRDEDNQINHATNSCNIESSVIFNLEAPPHAYPTTFPPRCDYDPFPSRTNTHIFAVPVWTRAPAKVLPSRPTPTIKELIAEFNVKLVIRDSLSRKYHNRGANTTSQSPWFATTHTRPPPAPHSAFIRFSPFPQDPLTTQLPYLPIPVTSSSPNPFQPPSPSTRFATLVSQTQQRSPSVSRKVAPLPRRSPTTSRFAHRGVSPTMSDAPSPSRSISPSSRISSFSSDVPLRRRLSSSSSSSSSSSTLNTPIMSPTTLPMDPRSPVVRLDLDNEGDVFGDLNKSYSPAQSLQCKPYLSPTLKFDFSMTIPAAYLSTH